MAQAMGYDVDRHDAVRILAGELDSLGMLDQYSDRRSERTV